MNKLHFKSLSVLDFIEESKDWDADNFIRNVYIHKEDLKKLDTTNKESIYYGCDKEIWHLIDFCRKILYYNEYHSDPAGISDEDYTRLKDLFHRFQVK